MSLDVFTMGEALLRLSVRSGDRLETATELEAHTAGAEANVAAALGRLGRAVAWWSKVPDDPLGRRVVAELRAAGVDVSRIAFEPGGRLGTYYVEMHAPPRTVSVLYDREASTAASITPGDLPLDLVGTARWVLVSGITPALSPSSRAAVDELVRAVRPGPAELAVDVNFRSKLWTAAEARECLLRIAASAGLLVCAREDARDVFELDGNPGDVLRSLARLTGARRVVVTLGADGAVALDEDGEHRVDALPTTVVDRLGAGDAFTAGVLDGLLDGSLEMGLRRGSALAAMVLGTHGDHLVGTRAEMDALLRGGGRSVDR